jgi:protein LTV1
MPRKSKPFIDRANAQHFNVIHRSQRDPLIHDDMAPRFVLQPVSRINGGKAVRGHPAI